MGRRFHPRQGGGIEAERLDAQDILDEERERSRRMEMAKIEYGFKREVPLPVHEVEAKLREELKKEGFGILTEIDVAVTLKQKLDVDFRPYKILGACNPPFAYRALQAEDKIGLMLPCNVIVQEQGDGKVEVAAVDPIASMQAVHNEKLGGIAVEIRGKLTKAIEAI